MIIIIYITGLFDNLYLGIKIVQVIFILSFFYNLIFIIKSIKNKEIKDEVKKIFTPGLFVYIGFFLLLIIINYNRIFEEYDEFNHWAVIVKNMYINNAYGTIENSIVTFNEYPPFTAIFQYLFLKLSGGYSEDLIIISQGMLYISIIIPICEHVDFGKNFSKLLLIIPTIIMLPLIFYKNFFINILVDGFLGVLFGIGMFLIYKENDFYRNVLFVLILIALILTKNIGVFFVILLILFECIKIIRKKENIKKIFVFLIISLVFICSWNIKITKTKAIREWKFNQEDFYINIKIKDEIINNYVKAVFLKESFTERHLSLIICITLLSVCFIYSYKISLNKREYIIKTIEFAVSLILFAIGLLILYIRIFNIDEANNLASFERYMSTILLSWLIFNFFVWDLKKEIKHSTYYIILIIMFAFMPLENIYTKYINNKEYINISHTKRNYYTKIKDYEDVLTLNDKVLFIVDEMSNQQIILKLNRYENIGSNINIINEDMNFLNNNTELDDMLNKADYVYIYILNDKKLISNNEVENNTLYKIHKNKDEFRLEKIDNLRE